MKRTLLFLVSMIAMIASGVTFCQSSMSFFVPRLGFQSSPRNQITAVNAAIQASEGTIFAGNFSSAVQYAPNGDIVLGPLNNLFGTLNGTSFINVGDVKDKYDDGSYKSIVSLSEINSVLYAGLDGSPFYEKRNDTDTLFQTVVQNLKEPVLYSQDWGGSNQLLMGGTYERGTVLKADGDFIHLHGPWGVGLYGNYVGGGYAIDDSSFIFAQMGVQYLYSTKYGDSIVQQYGPQLPHNTVAAVSVMNSSQIYVAEYTGDSSNHITVFSLNGKTETWDSLFSVTLNDVYLSHVKGLVVGNGVIYLGGGFKEGGVIAHKIAANETTPIALPYGIKTSESITGLYLVGDSLYLPTDATLDGYRLLPNGYQVTYVMATSIVLPLGLVSFTATAAGKGVVLNWKIGQGNLFDHFEIERSSNGQSFVSIGKVSVNSSGTYQYTDASPSSGNNYYRLKSVTKDGKQNYSQVQKVTFGNIQLSIFPNPVRSTIIISGNFSSKASIIDMNGKILQILQVNNVTTINVNNLTSGMYVLKFDNGTSKKFMKQ